jgi:hypothetical protein
VQNRGITLQPPRKPDSSGANCHMTKRPASVTEADYRRAIRAAKKEGAAEIEVRIKDQASIIIRLAASTDSVAVNQSPWDKPIAELQAGR